MREIKFRGKRVDNGEWVYGNLVTYFNKPSIQDYSQTNGEIFSVDPETVGQYTGLKDKNGNEIYEGDIVKGHWWKHGESHRHIGIVNYVMNAFKVRGVKQYLGIDDELSPTYEVIGNRFDNPELLGEVRE